MTGMDMKERMQSFTGMLSRTVVLLDNTPDPHGGADMAALFRERIREVLRPLEISPPRLFGGQAPEVVPGLGTRFTQIAQAAERPEHVIVVVNGKYGRHARDYATEVAALDLLEENKEMMIDFVQVYGGDRQRALRETAESIGGLTRLFSAARPAPSYVKVPDPDGLPREILSLALGRRVAQLGTAA